MVDWTEGTAAASAAERAAAYLLARIPGSPDVLKQISVADLIGSLSSSAVGQVARPAFVELFLSMCYGRGMADGELVNTNTVKAITAAAAAGTDTITVADNSSVVVGGSQTIKHANGRYFTYYVRSKGVNTIALLPKLKWPVGTSSSIEQTWYNKAHIGTYAQRAIAQRIKYGKEHNLALAHDERDLFTDFEAAGALSDLVAVSGGVINYYAASNTGISGNLASPVRFSGRTAYVTVTANGDGAKFGPFAIDESGARILEVTHRCEGEGTSYALQIFNGDDVKLAEQIFSASAENQLLTITKIPYHTRVGEEVYFKVVKVSGTANDIGINCIESYPAPSASSLVVSRSNAKILVAMDSWGADDGGRIGLYSALLEEYPNATIINASVGGNRLYEIRDRLQALLDTHQPDYVIYNGGVNDVYSPSSGTFEGPTIPNAVDNYVGHHDDVLNMIAKAGARAIIIGIPGLAQNDPEASGLPNWQLNDRARKYARAVRRNLAKFAGNTVSAPASAAFKGALVKRSTDATAQNFITAGQISFDTEIYDTDNFHSVSPNPARLTVPSGVSKVRVQAQIWCNNSASLNYILASIRKNGSEDYPGIGSQMADGSAVTPRVSISTAVINVTAGDYFELWLASESDTSIDIMAFGTWLSIQVIE